MLIGFGGPTRAAEVRPFLDRVLAGRPVPRERYEEVVGHYQALGGRSPYNEITMRQGAALQTELRRMGMRAPVVTGFRYTAPFIEDAVRDLKRRGIRRTLGFVLAAHRCDASWDRYLADVESARETLGPDAPKLEYPPAWHTEVGFLTAAADRARAALEQLCPTGRERAHLIFTAHSIPLSMSGRAGYVEQLNESARRIAQVLSHSKWTLAFQSRSGNPRDPWLEPDIKNVLRGLGGGQAVIVPLGFMCDHVEVLYDLDIEAAKVAREAGVSMVRAGTVGEHREFIEMIAKIAAQYISPASFETV
jgi:ferrochelatase